MKKKKLLCLILGIITLYTLSVPSFAYSDSGAQEYADKYANSHNPYYRHFFSDCTNFVSQCIHVGGGIPMGIVNKNPEDYRNWYYQKLAYFPDDWTNAWAVADTFKNFIKNEMHAIRAVSKWKHKDQFDKNGKRLAYAFINDSGNITGKDIEIIFYDWEDDGIIDHTAIVVGTNYSYDGTGYGDLVDTHTANHCHTLWTLQRYVSDEQVDTYAIYCFRIKC